MMAMFWRYVGDVLGFFLVLLYSGDMLAMCRICIDVALVMLGDVCGGVLPMFWLHVAVVVVVVRRRPS